MTTDLIIPITVETKDLFLPAGVDNILTAVDKKIAEFDCKETATSKDRDKIRSFSAKIVKTKTFLEKQGKELVAGEKAKLKMVDVERKRLRDSLSEKAAQVRQPLTEYETAEKERIEKERQAEIAKIEEEERLKKEELEAREKAIAEKEAELKKQEEEKRQKEESERQKKEQAERDERLKKEAAEDA
ncbi:MAG: hypothetical protein KAS32_10115, partial [Candidatus Peribacteraceae bacterium]|nr:hypothetical protein [Candidatus Peribacteraceae bacterium]